MLTPSYMSSGEGPPSRLCNLGVRTDGNPKEWSQVRTALPSEIYALQPDGVAAMLYRCKAFRARMHLMRSQIVADALHVRCLYPRRAGESFWFPARSYRGRAVPGSSDSAVGARSASVYPGNAALHKRSARCGHRRDQPRDHTTVTERWESPSACDHVRTRRRGRL